MIPKIIHYCWLSGQEYPDDIKINLASWKKLLPDYEFMLWDAKRSEAIDCLWTQQALKSKKYAFASDLIRLHAVYTYGGIYLDCDVEIIKSLDPLIHLPYFMGSERNSFIEAAIFGSEKKSQWISNIIRYYFNRNFIKEDGSLDMTVLPSIMKSRMELLGEIKIMDADDLRDLSIMQKNKSMFYLFPFQYFSPKDIETGEISITTESYTIHHFSSAWLPVSSKLRRRLMRTIGLKRTESIIASLGLRKLRTFLKHLWFKHVKKPSR